MHCRRLQLSSSSRNMKNVSQFLSLYLFPFNQVNKCFFSHALSFHISAYWGIWKASVKAIIAYLTMYVAYCKQLEPVKKGYGR